MFNWFFNLFNPIFSIGKTADLATEAKRKKEVAADPELEQMDVPEKEQAQQLADSIQSQLDKASANFNPGTIILPEELFNSISDVIPQEWLTAGFWEKALNEKFFKDGNFNLGAAKGLHNSSLDAFLADPSTADWAGSIIFGLIRYFLASIDPSKMTQTVGEVKKAVDEFNQNKTTLIRQNTKNPANRLMSDKEIMNLIEPADGEKNSQAVKEYNHLKDVLKNTIFSILHKDMSRLFNSYSASQPVGKLFGNAVKYQQGGKVQDAATTSLDQEVNDKDGEDGGTTVQDLLPDNEQTQKLEDLFDAIFIPNKMSDGEKADLEYTKENVQRMLDISTWLAKKKLQEKYGNMHDNSGLVNLMRFNLSKKIAERLGSAEYLADFKKLPPNTYTELAIPNENTLNTALKNFFNNLEVANPNGGDPIKVSTFADYVNGIKMGAKFFSPARTKVNDKNKTPTSVDTLQTYEDMGNEFLSAIPEGEERSAAYDKLNLDFANQLQKSISDVSNAGSSEDYANKASMSKDVLKNLVSKEEAKLKKIEAFAKSEALVYALSYLQNARKHTKKQVDRLFPEKYRASAMESVDAEYKVLRDYAEKAVSKLSKAAINADATAANMFAKYNIADALSNQVDYLQDQLAAGKDITDANGNIKHVDFAGAKELLDKAFVAKEGDTEPVAFTNLLKAPSNRVFTAKMDEIKNSVLQATRLAGEEVKNAGGDANEFYSTLNGKFNKLYGYSLGASVPTNPADVTELYTKVYNDVAGKLARDQKTKEYSVAYVEEELLPKENKQLMKDAQKVNQLTETLDKIQAQLDAPEGLSEEQIAALQDKKDNIASKIDKLEHREAVGRNYIQSLERYIRRPDAAIFQQDFKSKHITPSDTAKSGEVVTLLSGQEAVVERNKGKYIPVVGYSESDKPILGSHYAKEPALSEKLDLYATVKNGDADVFVFDNLRGRGFLVNKFPISEDPTASIALEPQVLYEDAVHLGALKPLSADEAKALISKETGEEVKSINGVIDAKEPATKTEPYTEPEPKPEPEQPAAEEKPAQEPVKEEEEPSDDSFSFNTKPVEEKQDREAGFSFSGIHRQADFEFSYEPDFTFHKVAYDETRPNDTELQKTIEQAMGGGTEAEPEIREHNLHDNQTLQQGQQSMEQDIADSRSFSSKKVAQALKMAYDTDQGFFNELVEVVRNSNPTTGDSTADVLANLPNSEWTMEAAMRKYNSTAVEPRNRNYFQECLKNYGWPALLKNDKFAKLLKQFNQGQAK